MCCPSGNHHKYTLLAGEVRVTGQPISHHANLEAFSAA